MPRINRQNLRNLFRSHDIKDIWSSSQSLNVINHPDRGLISPHAYRYLGQGRPCPYCAQKMVHGQKIFTTSSKSDAIDRGYQYINRSGQPYINHVGDEFFHQHYITIDHKINKARCPEKMFDYDNLELICWRCNLEKGDNNAYELQHNSEYLSSLADAAIARYCSL